MAGYAVAGAQVISSILGKNAANHAADQAGKQYPWKPEDVDELYRQATEALKKYGLTQEQADQLFKQGMSSLTSTQSGANALYGQQKTGLAQMADIIKGRIADGGGLSNEEQGYLGGTLRKEMNDTFAKTLGPEAQKNSLAAGAVANAGERATQDEINNRVNLAIQNKQLKDKYQQDTAGMIGTELNTTPSGLSLLAQLPSQFLNYQQAQQNQANLEKALYDQYVGAIGQQHAIGATSTGHYPDTPAPVTPPPAGGGGGGGGTGTAGDHYASFWGQFKNDPNARTSSFKASGSPYGSGFHTNKNAWQNDYSYWQQQWNK